MSVIPVEDLLAYLNEARTNPKKFSVYVKKQMDTFIDQSTLPLVKGCNYATNQGKGSWKEAYEFLTSQKPLPAYQPNQGLCLAAMDHAMDMKQNHFFDHSSSNGMSFSDRIKRRCGDSYGASAQNLGSDFDVEGRNHALQTVMGLIIDDGVKSRGHRKNIFNPSLNYIGIFSVKMDKKYKTCMNFHSENLKVIEPSKSPLIGGNNSKGPQKSSGFGNSSGNNFEKEFQKMKLQGNENKGEWKMTTNGNQGERYVTSKSTNTSTTTKNGKTTKITTTKIKYSDGSTEQQVKQQTF